MTDRYLGMDFSDLSFVEEQKLKGFFHRFTEEYYNEYKIGHIIFAAYAAVPTYINPDLLYKIWMNFKEYQWRNDSEQIHLVAVVDLINSSFCEEIGPKLYKLNKGIKNVLIEWLRKEVELNIKKNASENDIAHFINAELKHVQKDYKLWGGEEYVFDQGLNADLLVYPERAMEKIKQVLYQAKSDTEKLLAFNLLMDAKKKISTEINFDEITELGKGWKEYLLGKPTKLLKKIENLENSFLKDEPTTSRSMEITLPQEIVKEEIARKKKKKIYGVFVGIDEYEDASIDNLDYCAKDARQIHDALHKSIDSEKNKIDFKLLINKKATYDNVRKYFDELKGLDNGDTFIFYYSGRVTSGEVWSVDQGGGRDFLLEDSYLIRAKGTGMMEDTLSQYQLESVIYQVIQAKNIHCLFLFDCFDEIESQKYHLNESKLRNDNDMKGSLVIIDRADSKVTIDNKTINKKFTNSLINVFQEGGLYMNYNEFFKKIKLNNLQQNSLKENEYIPRIEAFPSESIHYKFLNNTENLYDNLEIYFNKNRSQWEVNAGFNKGINSSIPMMPTTLEANVGGKRLLWEVKRAYLDYSTLDMPVFKESAGMKFKAKLLQNSLKEILFFIDEEEFDRSRIQELSRYIRQKKPSLIGITGNKLEAKYVISYNNILGYFTYDPLYGETLSIINVRNNIEEFITYLEFLAQWEGIIQYSNLNSKLNSKDFEWAFLLNNELEVKQLFNVNQIDIKVRRIFKSQTFSKKQISNDTEEETEVECTITSKDLSTNKEIKETIDLKRINGRNPELSFELFKGLEDSNFGLSMLILDDNLSIEEVSTFYTYKENQAIRSLDYSYINAVRSKLKKNKQLYLKIFLSNKQLNYRPFLQEGINKDIRSKRGVDGVFYSSGEVFDASEVDWVSYTIPININLDEFNETEELLNSDDVPMNIDPEMTGNKNFTKKSIQVDDFDEKGRRRKLRDLASHSGLENAIEKLGEYLNEKGIGKDFKNLLIVIQSRYRQMEDNFTKGILTKNQYDLERNRIRESILSLSELDDDRFS